MHTQRIRSVCLLAAIAASACRAVAGAPQPRAGIANCEVTRPTGDYAVLVLKLTIPGEPKHADPSKRQPWNWTYVGGLRDGRMRVDDGVGLREPGGRLELRDGRLTGSFRRVDLGATVRVDATVKDDLLRGAAQVGERQAIVAGWIVPEDELARSNAVAKDRSWPAAQGPLGGGCCAEATGAATIDDLARIRLVWRCEESDVGRGMGNISRFMSNWPSASRLRTGSGCSSPLVADGKVYFRYFVPAPRSADTPERPIEAYNLTEAAAHKQMLEEARRYGFQGDKLPTYAAEKMYQCTDDVMLCMDAATGKTLWKAVAKGRGINSQHHKAGPFDMSPACANGRVFSLGMSGWLYAFDATTGKPLWEVQSECDYSNALLAVGDVVVAPAGREWGGYDAATGRLVWTAGGGRAVSTLSAWSTDGKDYLIGVMGPNYASKGIGCLEAATGKQVWNVPVKVITGGRGLGPGGISVIGDRLLVNQNNGTGKKGDPVKPVIAAYHLTATKAKPLWQLGPDEDAARVQSLGGGSAHRSPVHGESVPVVVHGKYVFAADLRVADLATGKVLAKTEGLVPMNGGFMQAIEDIVLVRRDGTHGNMECGFYKIGRDGSVRPLTKAAWIPPIGGTTTSYHHPLFYAMADGRIFFRQENGVYCWDVRAKRARKAQTIDLPSIAHQPAKAGRVNPRAQASSGLPAWLRVVSGPAAVAGGQIELSGTPGIVTVEASQPGSPNFLPAPAVQRLFAVGQPVPTVPSRVEASGTASTIAVLSWTHDGKVVDAFEVERSRDGRAWEEIARVPAGQRQLLDRGLEPATTYRYRLRAANTFFRSGLAPTVSAATHKEDRTAYFEAEAGQVGSGWRVVQEKGASGDKAVEAVHSPFQHNTRDPQDVVQLAFDWPLDGPIAVWVRGRSPAGGTSDSAFVRVDGGKWAYLGYPSSGEWAWNVETFQVRAGRHTVGVGIREPRVHVDRVFITNGEQRPR